MLPTKFCVGKHQSRGPEIFFCFSSGPAKKIFFVFLELFWNQFFKFLGSKIYNFMIFFKKKFENFRFFSKNFIFSKKVPNGLKPSKNHFWVGLEVRKGVFEAFGHIFAAPRGCFGGRRRDLGQTHGVTYFEKYGKIRKNYFFFQKGPK